MHAPEPDLLWPAYDHPGALATIESIALEDRGLPGSTYDLLARAAVLWPDRPALTMLPSAGQWTHGETVSFGQLRDQTHRIANLFHRHGVRRTTAVGLLSPNAGLLPATLLAAQLAGCAAPVNPALAADHAERLLALAGARVLVAAGPELDAAAWRTARTAAASLRCSALFALRPVGAPEPTPELEPIEGVHVAYLHVEAAAQPAELHPGVVPPKAGDLAAYFHTGGTTGAPKLAAHTHANEVTDAWMIAANSTLDPDSVLFAGLPLFHVNALVVTLLAPLFRGQHGVWTGPLGYREPALFAVFWKIVAHFRIATLSAVPTVYAALARIPVDADITSLRFAIVGASPLPPAVRAAFEHHTGVPLCQGYGLTEATCGSARSFLHEHRRPEAAGQRMPYQHVKTVGIDSDGTWHDLPQGEPGILAISGPTVFPGYVVGHDDTGPRLETLGSVRDGWLNTGDLARVDSDGFIHLLGRAKDLIIRGGHNMDPAVIEDALLTHPAVTGASAVGRPDPHSGEVPIAYVTLRPGTTGTGPEELIAFAAQHVPERAAAPKEVIVLSALPLTDIGKPSKVPLRLDATRRAISTALAGLGIAGVDEQIRCELADGRPMVSLPPVADPDQRRRIIAQLAPYDVSWAFTDHGTS
ncbi:acyl-CoA synthetase [Streptomyces sp. NBC_00523]|uniref:acyl-CoA synthetase n=1 Tax=Streptomyces sp. NBC_00523 TaxID=2975765 RepID=UPI002E800FD1|nr:acyl-CoA synthetase [Streptomyces sp. NBC_00523]WUD04064.1 acyl-CoA synthetase [Streptomyces sp. NBC_00523]